MAKNFEGDVLLFQTLDDGEIWVEDGLVSMTCGFDTAVYLSLFGGNVEDRGGDDTSFQYWGNLIAKTDAEAYRSEFQHLSAGIPLTTSNLRRLEQAAYRDLQWVVSGDNAFATSLTVSVSMTDRDTVLLSISVGAESEVSYSLNWECGVTTQGGFGFEYVKPVPPPPPPPGEPQGPLVYGAFIINA